VFSFSAGLAALLPLAAPDKVMAQYRGYPTAPQYSPYQRPYDPYQPGPSTEELDGTWFLYGNQNDPCQVIPSRRGDRALFINEQGQRAEGFLRGNRIFVPAWRNIEGRYRGDTIRWSNGTVWSR
jgi:hypothetical protein